MATTKINALRLDEIAKYADAVELALSKVEFASIPNSLTNFVDDEGKLKTAEECYKQLQKMHKANQAVIETNWINALQAIASVPCGEKTLDLINEKTECLRKRAVKSGCNAYHMVNTTCSAKGIPSAIRSIRNMYTTSKSEQVTDGQKRVLVWRFKIAPELVPYIQNSQWRAWLQTLVQNGEWDKAKEDFLKVNEEEMQEHENDPDFWD